MPKKFKLFGSKKVSPSCNEGPSVDSSGTINPKESPQASLASAADSSGSSSGSRSRKSISWALVNEATNASKNETGLANSSNGDEKPGPSDVQRKETNVEDPGVIRQTKGRPGIDSILFIRANQRKWGPPTRKLSTTSTQTSNSTTLNEHAAGRVNDDGSSWDTHVNGGSKCGGELPGSVHSSEGHSDSFTGVVIQKPGINVPENIELEERPIKGANNVPSDISKSITSQGTQTEDQMFAEDAMQQNLDQLAVQVETPECGVWAKATSLPRTVWNSLKRFLVEKQLEAAIRFDYILGLCPFRINQNGQLETSKRAKVMFLTIAGLAALNVLKNVGAMSSYKSLDNAKDHSFWDIAIAFHLSMFFMLMTYDILVWFMQKTVKSTFRTVHQTPPPANNLTRVSGTVLRTISVVAALFLTFGGFTSLNKASDYSMWDILQKHENDIIQACLSKATQNAMKSKFTEPNNMTDLHHNITMIMSDNVTNIIANAVNTTLTNITATLVNSTAKAIEETGIFFENPAVETFILGIVGVILDVAGQIAYTSAPDTLLLITFQIWLMIRELRVDDLTLESLNGLVGEEREREFQRLRKLARKRLARRDEIMRSSSQLNEMVKIFWPALAFTASFMASYFLHLLLIGMLFQAFYFFVHLLKVAGIFVFAILIAIIEDQFNDWFVSDEARQLLDLDLYEFQRRGVEIERKPIGIGSGPFLIKMTFLVSFLGVVCSNLVMVFQAFYA